MDCATPPLPPASGGVIWRQPNTTAQRPVPLTPWLVLTRERSADPLLKSSDFRFSHEAELASTVDRQGNPLPKWPEIHAHKLLPLARTPVPPKIGRLRLGHPVA